MKKPKIKKDNPLFQNCKVLIDLYLHTGDKINWPREIKIAKKLLSLWPDINFWKQYDPQRRFHSLSVFLTKPVKKELDKNFSLYNLTKPREFIILSDKPVINIEECLINKTKSRTLQEFVDNII